MNRKRALALLSLRDGELPRTVKAVADALDAAERRALTRAIARVKRFRECHSPSHQYRERMVLDSVIDQMAALLRRTRKAKS